MKEITDFRTFKKAVRKYWKRHARKEVYCTHDGKHKATCYWTDKIFAIYKVTDLDMLDRSDVQSYLMFDVHEEDIPETIATFKKYITEHTPLKFEAYADKERYYTGTLRGLILTNNCVAYLIDDLTDKYGTKVEDKIGLGFEYKIIELC